MLSLVPPPQIFIRGGPHAPITRVTLSNFYSSRYNYWYMYKYLYEYMQEQPIRVWRDYVLVLHSAHYCIPKYTKVLSSLYNKGSQSEKAKNSSIPNV